MIPSWSEHTPATPSLRRGLPLVALPKDRRSSWDCQNGTWRSFSRHGRAHNLRKSKPTVRRMQQTTLTWILISRRQRDFILKRSFHTELQEVRLIPRFVLKSDRIGSCS